MIILCTHKRHLIGSRYGVSVVSILDKVDFKLEHWLQIRTAPDCISYAETGTIYSVYGPRQWEMVLHRNAVWGNTQNDPGWESWGTQIFPLLNWTGDRVSCLSFPWWSIFPCRQIQGSRQPWQMHGQVLQKGILGQCSGISGVVYQKIVIGCSC